MSEGSLAKVVNQDNPSSPTRQIEGEFRRQNRDLWSSFPDREGTERLLIEPPAAPISTHVNAIFTLILNQAKNYRPVWIAGADPSDLDLMKSYVPSTEFVPNPSRTTFGKLFSILIALWKYLFLRIHGDLLLFHYDGVKYGDLVYDEHLQRSQTATIRKIQFLPILRLLAACIFWHRATLSILKSGKFAGVLVSHQIGIPSGVMLRAALRHGYAGYIRRGGHFHATLQRHERLEDIYHNEYKPTPEDIAEIFERLGSNFDRSFQALLDKRTLGKSPDIDAALAYSDRNRLFTDRAEFNRHYNLDPKRKNVFVMLHAFTDHPHSHFRSMLFRDYYDWFFETLQFARTHSHVNWIFKEHPSMEFYPTRDVCVDKLFADAPDHLRYVRQKDRLNTRSLKYCADVVITCLGSAGFEMPAVAKIPSVTAGDNYYSDLGFALEPKSKSEYFDILQGADKIKRLSVDQQKRAQAAFMHIFSFAPLKMTACPTLSLSEMKEGLPPPQAWKLLLDLYQAHGPSILRETKDLIEMVRQPNFRRLNGLSKYCEQNLSEKRQG